MPKGFRDKGVKFDTKQNYKFLKLVDDFLLRKVVRQSSYSDD